MSPSAPSASATAARAGEAADLAGLGVAALCVVHCLVLPLASVLLPALALDATAGERVELGLVLAGLGLGAAAILPGARRRRDARPLALLAAAAALLLLALLALPEGRLAEGATVAGATLLGVAHLRNRTGRRERAARSGVELRRARRP